MAPHGITEVARLRRQRGSSEGPVGVTHIPGGSVKTAGRWGRLGTLSPRVLGSLRVVSPAEAVRPAHVAAQGSAWQHVATAVSPGPGRASLLLGSVGQSRHRRARGQGKGT